MLSSLALNVHTMYVPCTYMFMIFHNCKYHAHKYIYTS